MADEKATVDSVSEVPTDTLEDIPNEIIAACNAIDTMDNIDTAMMSKQDEIKKKRIVRRALAIIDNHIGYLYDCVFDDKDKDTTE